MNDTRVFTLTLPGMNAWDAVTVDPSDVRETVVPWSGRTVTGYGGRRTPTPYMIRHGNRWHRVRVMSYGNAGSAYITIRGEIAWVEMY